MMQKLTTVINGMDWQMAILNVTSFGTIYAWVTENASGVGGFIVMVSIAVLNCAKAYSFVKNANNKDEQ